MVQLENILNDGTLCHIYEYYQESILSGDQDEIEESQKQVVDHLNIYYNIKDVKTVLEEIYDTAFISEMSYIEFAELINNITEENN